MYFFKSDDIVYNKYIVATFVDSLSEFGGIFAIIRAFFGYLAMFINEKVIKAKFVRSLYFAKKPKHQQPKFHIKLGHCFMSQKINKYRTLRTKFYNLFRKSANRD